MKRYLILVKSVQILTYERYQESAPNIIFAINQLLDRYDLSIDKIVEVILLQD